MIHIAKLPTPETLRGDVKGGVTAALAALPVELVYGLFAIAPLGMAYAEHGMRAALWGCILCGILGFVLRGTGGMLTGTRPATGLILGALAASLLHQPAITSAGNPEVLVFSLLLLCTALAGLFQYLLGLAQVGRTLKYIPFPVTAGLMLGVGLLMFLGNLRQALGADYQTPWPALFQAWHPSSIIVSVTVLAICFWAQRRKTVIPGSMLALLFGTLIHHGLVALFGSASLGGNSASIQHLLPDYQLWNANLEIFDLIDWLPEIASYAIAIAALASLETLLCLSAIGNALGKRPEGNAELRTQGLANLIGGLFGATVSPGNVTRVRINLSTGGSGRLSGLAYAITLGLMVVLAGQYLSLIPYAVTSSIVIYYAIGMVDDGTRRMFQQLVIQRKEVGRKYYRLLLANFSVTLLVALVAVLGDLMKAVAIGLAAAMVLFVSASFKPVIRRVTHGTQRSSLKIRTMEDVGLLRQEGGQIAIIEAEGPLFFGTADSIAHEIEKVSATANLLIIDLKRVRDIDTSGARTLLQAARKLVTQQKTLLFSGANPHFEEFLNAMGLESVIPKGNWHHDLDYALEDAEDRLLMRLGVHASHRALTLAETSLVTGLTQDEIAILADYLDVREHTSPVQLFAMGDAGDSLFVAGGSNVDILVPLKGGKHKRIVSLGPGVIFGEIAMLEGRPRSAAAVVLGPSVVWQLTRTALDRLLQSHPNIARQVLFNVGCQMAGRLRIITDELILLEES